MNECKKGNWVGGGGGFYPSCKKHGGGVISTYTKMTRGDSFRGGFCPTLWAANSVAQWLCDLSGRDSNSTKIMHFLVACKFKNDGQKTTE